jgi:transposase
METNVNWKEIVAEKDARIAQLEALVKFYEEQFRLSKSRQFGASSEQGLLSEQLGIFNEVESTADPNMPEPELEEIIYTRRKRVGKRKDDLSALPVEVVEHTLPEEERVCPECGGELHAMGHDIRRELKIIPAQVKVVEHKRAVYSCRNCEKENDHVPIVKAPMPEPVIKGSLASPSAVAHIMTQKYVMCAPLYRQELDWKWQGVALSRQTMANWVIRCAHDWLLPLYVLLRTILLTCSILHADETVVQVLNEPGKTPQSNSYMWLYRTSGDVERHIILYEYQPSRSHIHPKNFLRNFKGLLHADGYKGYHILPPEITVVGCWIHLRRKFADALKAMPVEMRSTSIAQEAILKIGYLFHLEDQWQSLTSEKRYEQRLLESKPLAEEFFKWLENLAVLPKSAIGRAVNYGLEQRQWLMNVYIDGRTELSNNRIENTVRPFAVGRKNWLFCDTVDGANASAMVYSIIETAKANGLKPFEYLEFLFETMPNATMNQLDSFLPWGEAVPDRCRMPVKKDGDQHSEK